MKYNAFFTEVRGRPIKDIASDVMAQVARRHTGDDSV